MTFESGSKWQIIPQNSLTSIVLIILFFYLLIRHFIFFLIILIWLRQFYWLPISGRRLGALVHWVIAVAMLGGFVLIGALVGWVEVVPA